MVECGWTEKKIRIFVRETLGMVPIEGVRIRYGNAEAVSEEIFTTDEAGIVEFCYPRLSTVYVSLQKTDYVFSTSLSKKEKGEFESWGASSEWVRALGMTTFLYGIKKPPELPPVEEVIEEVEEVIEEVEEVIEKIIEEVCRTEADPTVPAALSAYFPISIRNARWICDGKPENITGTGIIRIKGSEVARIPIRNGYGSPINLGTIPEFKDLLKELVG